MYQNIKFFAVIVCWMLHSGGMAQTSYLDPGFGDNGVSLAPSFTPTSIAMQEDAKILVAGKTGNASKVYRYNPDGSLDQGFGDQGIAAINIINPVGIKQLADNKILVVGNRSLGTMGGITGRIVFSRRHADGSVDSTFGVNGVVTINAYAQQSSMQTITAPVKVKFLEDGHIVIVGRIGYSYMNPLAAGPSSLTRVGPLVTRLNPDFTLDTTFAGTGYSKLPYTVATQFNDLEVLPDGSVLAGLQSGGNIRLYKYLPDGTPDPAFGTAGMQVVDIGTSDDKITDIKVLADGGIVISGSRAGTSRNAFIARLTENGVLDPSYGTYGILEFTNDSGQPENAVETLVLSNGTLVTGLQKWAGNYNFESVFTTPSGTIDVFTGNNGMIQVPLNDNEQLSCMLQQPDGKVIMAGYSENNCVLVRYHVVSVLGTAAIDQPEIVISPNPAEDMITVSGLPEHTQLALYNLSGQLIRETVTNGITQMDLGSCTPGVYLLKSGGNVMKVVKR